MVEEPDKFYFTVGQLMDALKNLPKELPVLLSGQKSGYENFFQPDVVEMIHEPDNGYTDGEFQVYQEKYHTGEKTFKAVLLGRVVRDD